MAKRGDVVRQGRRQNAWGSRVRAHSWCALIVAVAVPALAAHSGAQDAAPQASAEPTAAAAAADRRQTEVWAGADGFSRVWSSYMGASIAPFGSILEDGTRIRIVTGYGRYQFGGKQARVQGRVGFVDGLLGYHLRTGELTVKVFSGVAFAHNTYTPYQPVEAGNARTLGAKGLVELWYNLPRDGFASLDVGYATVMSSAWARGRLGFGLAPGRTAGVEAGYVGSIKPQPIRDEFGAIGAIQPESFRLGAFTRMGLMGGELDLSAGWSRTRDALQTKGAISEPYAGAQWLTRF